MRWNTLLPLMALGAVLGCGYQPAPAPPKPAITPQASRQPATPAPATQSGLTGGMQGIGTAAGLAPMDLANGPEGVAPVRPANPTLPQPAPTYQKAEVGVGAKGRDYGGGAIMAPITVPAATYFRAQERIAFNLVVDGLKKYDALNGHLPRNQQEFDAMIKEFMIKLPQLPPGEEYVYDPNPSELSEKLRVKKPGR